MDNRRRSDTGSGQSFLARLARDKRGNTFMLVAAAIFPLVGMVGGAIDLSRLYMVKTRLQHACDAGALAGRKQMGGGAWTTTGNNSSNSVAEQLFDGNFPASAYGAEGTAKSFTETNGNVNGTASATVPMTLMAVFHFPGKLLSVTCQAQEQVPNTDVMFVLDNTESMSEAPDGSGHMQAGSGTPGNQSKIYNLKADVKCFFEALSKLETNEATCDAITGVSTTSRLRFGLVPYSTAVNVKQLNLPTSYFAKSWNYQSRKWSSNQWEYDKYSYDVTDFYKSPNTITLRLAAKGKSKDFTWDGCTEETSPLTDINAKPDSSDDKTLYAPTIPGAIYYRKQSPTANELINGNNLQTAMYATTDDLFSASLGHYYYNCPAAAYGLEQYGSGGTAVTTFVNRVDAMTYGGNTRHDIGMLWGGRLISPHGMFSAGNRTPPNGGRLYRHVVFMTDGDAKANECDYATYGVPWFDKREVTPSTTVDKSTCVNLGANTTLTNGVYNRLATLCTAVKNEPDTVLWVISFGSNDTKISPAAKTKLAGCATDGNHFFDATDNDSLKKAFKQIAAQISQLRIVQ